MYKAKTQLLGAMGIFGTIGIFIRYIPLPSATIAFVRGLLGVVFLTLVMLLTKQKPDWQAIKKNLLILCVSGAAIGFNWILLFESYKHTTVATATVCYYLAPLLLLLTSPFLGEKLTVKKIGCITAALIGMVFVSGITQDALPTADQLQGVVLGVGAAALYATVMFLNKKLSPIGAYDKTILQLGAATVVLLPYLLVSQQMTLHPLTGIQWCLLLFVGVVHTGFAYWLYFSSIRELPTQTIALFSYLDPVLAILLSAFFLGEPMTLSGMIGTVLILGSALYSELPKKE